MNLTWPKESVTEALSTAGIDVLNEGMTISPEFEEKNIHQFRVATKKLRALLRLLENSHESVSSKMPKNFKELYSLSGNVRDGQLMIHRVKETTPEIPEYLAHLEATLMQDKLNFTGFYDSAILNKLAKKLKKMEPEALTQEAVEAFFKTRFAEIEGILNKTVLEEEDLHDIRKKIKDLQHIAKTLKGYWPEVLENSPISQSLEQMETLAKEAGDFNDQHNALHHLEGFAAKTTPTANLKTVLAEWNESKEIAQKKLVAEIVRFKDSGKKAMEA